MGEEIKVRGGDFEGFINHTTDSDAKENPPSDCETTAPRLLPIRPGELSSPI